MDKEAVVIDYCSRMIEMIDGFRWAGTSDEIIVKRIYHLCRFERNEAQKKIDEKLDEMEQQIKDKLKDIV